MKTGKPKTGETDSRKRQYAIWLGIPISARGEDERTQSQYSQKYFITEKTLSKWKRDPEVQAIAQDALKILGGRDVMQVIQTMTELAKIADPKNFNDRKLFLEWQGQVGTKKDDNLPIEFKVSFETNKK